MVLGNDAAPFRGMIDEFRFWRKALTTTEIQQTCNQPLDNVEEQMTNNKLVVYYDFNQSTGNVNSATGADYLGTRSGFGPDGDAWSSSLGVFTLDFSPLQKDQNVTANYLTNYKAPFLYTDKRVNTTDYVSRYFQLETGTATSGWKMENTTQEGKTITGAYVDSYFGYEMACITGDHGFAATLSNQKTYQTVTLPAGLYRLEVVPGTKANSPTGSYIVVTEADTLAGNDDLANTLAYGYLNDMELEFFLDTEKEVSLGFIFNLNSALALSINEIKLIKTPYEFHYSGDLTGIESQSRTVTKSQSNATYDLQGRKIGADMFETSPYKRGINIIRMSDGTTRKVVVK